MARRARRGARAARRAREPAVELARAAVAIAAATDALLDHADARMALATALRAAGRDAEADAEETRALELWEAKGATLLVERTGAGATPGDAARAATPTQRSVRSNFATLHAHRLDALIAARNSQALPDLFVESVEVIHHTMGASYGRDAAVQRFAMAIDGGDALVVAHEPVATLGDALGLFRVRLVADRFESESEALSTGAFEIELAVVIEADAEGRALRGEIFAAERLAEAVARIYQRLAELEPAGAMRDAAATRARCVAAILALDDGGDFTELVAADVAAVDHRVLGFGVSRGAEAVRDSMRALHDLASELSVRVDDVLALERDCLLLRSTTLGVDRAERRPLRAPDAPDPLLRRRRPHDAHRVVRGRPRGRRARALRGAHRDRRRPRRAACVRTPQPRTSRASTPRWPHATAPRSSPSSPQTSRRSTTRFAPASDAMARSCPCTGRSAAATSCSATSRSRRSATRSRCPSIGWDERLRSAARSTSAPSTSMASG